MTEPTERDNMITSLDQGLKMMKLCISANSAMGLVMVLHIPSKHKTNSRSSKNSIGGKSMDKLLYKVFSIKPSLKI